MMAFVAFAANAQYKGASYLELAGGVTMYDGIDGRMELSTTPSPNLYAALKYGYLCSNKVTIEANFSFRYLTDDYYWFHVHTYAVSPTVYVNCWNRNRFTFYLGAGVTGGIQHLLLKDDMYYLLNEDGSFYEKKAELIGGVFICPKFEYKFVDNWALTIQAAPELQFNSVRKMNYPVSLGIKWYM